MVFCVLVSTFFKILS